MGGTTERQGLRRSREPLYTRLAGPFLFGAWNLAERARNGPCVKGKAVPCRAKIAELPKGSHLYFLPSFPHRAAALDDLVCRTWWGDELMWSSRRTRRALG